MMEKLYYAQVETSFRNKNKVVTEFLDLKVIEEDNERYIVFSEDEEIAVYKDIYDSDSFTLNQVRNPYAGSVGGFNGEDFEIAVISYSHEKAVDLLKDFIKTTTTNQLETLKINELKAMEHLRI